MEELPRAPFLKRDDQSGVLELSEMVHHGDPRGIEMLRERADGHSGLDLEEIEDLATRGVAERVEDGSHIVEDRIAGCAHR